MLQLVFGLAADVWSLTIATNRSTAIRQGRSDPLLQRHTVEVTAPTGHTYRSTAPPLPGTSTSRAEIHFSRSLLIA